INYLDLLERAMGIEPTTRSLGSYCSTTELQPRPARVLSWAAGGEKRRFTRGGCSLVLRTEARPLLMAREDGNGRHRACAAQEIRRPRRHRQGRAPRARRAWRLAYAMDQHGQPLQYHLPQLLYRLE